MKQLGKIDVVKQVDTSPDTSYLGHYSNSDEGNPLAIDRNDHGVWESREFRYFIPGNDYSDCTKKDREQYALQDFKRMESLNNGDWCYVGIKAFATIETSEKGNAWLVNQISSGGVWGIESDSDEKYLKEIAETEIAELAAVLLEMGFDKAEIDQKCAEALENL